MAPDALVDRRVTTVSLDDSGFVDALTRGKTITLVMSPDDVDKDPLILTDIPVLDWRIVDDVAWIVVAVPADRVSEFAKYVGGSTAIVLR